MSIQTLTVTGQPSRPGLLVRMREAIRSVVGGSFTLKDIAKWQELTGRVSAAGIPVTLENCFTYSAVYDAVNQGSSDIAKMPLNPYKQREDGGSDIHVDSKLYRLLKHEPNPEMGSMVFRRTLTAHALTSHGGYAEIERDGLDRPVALWPLTPDRVRPFREEIYGRDGRKEYGPLKYKVDGVDNLPARDVLHIQGLGYDGYLGYSVIDKARHAIGLALAAERYGSMFFSNGTTMGGLVSTDIPIGPEAEKAMRETLEGYHKGSDKAHRLLVLSGGWKYSRFGVTPSESQMNDLRTKQVEEVARFFNFPVHKLKNLDRATNNNIEQQDLEYYKGFILTWITLWEEELNRKLIPRLESRQQYIKHNANVFLRGDIKSRYDALGIARDKGIINADEWRDLEEMNPQPGGQGKLYLVQQAMVPANKLTALVDSQIKKNETKKAPPTPTKTDQDVQDANDRAAKAEQIAEEARIAAAVAREALAAAEARGTANTEEIAALRAAAEQKNALESQLTLLADEQRRRVDDLVAAKEGLTADVTREVAARVEAERTAADALAAIERAEADRDEKIAAAATADERARLAQVASDEAHQRQIAAELVASDETADRVAAEAARDEATLAAAAAAGNFAICDQARLQAEAAATEARTALEVAKAQDDELAAAETERAAAETARALEAEQRAAASEETRQREQEASQQAMAADKAAAALASEQFAAQLEAERAASQQKLDALETSSRALSEQVAALQVLLTDTQGTHDTQLESLRTAQTALERERDEARTAHAAAEARVAEEALGRQRTEEALRSQEQADAAGAAAIIASHRAMVVDIMRRMVERETDRARRAQSTPEKLKAWLEHFYDGHEDLCRTALLPAVRIHLAWLRSTDDPIETTRRLVVAHVDDSKRQVRVMLDGDADELAASFPALLHRWEVERVTVIADVLMQKELDYARTR